MAKEIYQDDNGNNLPTIESWDVIVKTTDGQELSLTTDLGFSLDDSITQDIDELLTNKYHCTWQE